MVTGAASGIGRAVATLRAAAGDFVYVLDADRTGGRQIVDKMSADGAAGEFIELDLTVPAGVDEAADRIMARHGHVDMLATCAGITGPGALETLSHESWARVLDVNLNGTFYIMQSLARRLIAAGQPSAFVTVASVAASRGEAGRGAYCVSKAAVVALTRLAAAEWSARGIRVNCVAPGYVDTPMMHSAFADRLIDRDTLLGRIPMRRLAAAYEIAQSIDFLASERASYVSGHVLAVDGGFLVDYGVPLQDAVR